MFPDDGRVHPWCAQAKSRAYNGMVIFGGLNGLRNRLGVNKTVFDVSKTPKMSFNSPLAPRYDPERTTSYTFRLFSLTHKVKKCTTSIWNQEK